MSIGSIPLLWLRFQHCREFAAESVSIAGPARRQIVPVANRETSCQIAWRVTDDANRTPDEMLGSCEGCSNLILYGRGIRPIIIAKVNTLDGRGARPDRPTSHPKSRWRGIRMSRPIYNIGSRRAHLEREDTRRATVKHS